MCLLCWRVSDSDIRQATTATTGRQALNLDVDACRTRIQTHSSVSNTLSSNPPPSPPMFPVKSIDRYKITNPEGRTRNPARRTERASVEASVGGDSRESSPHTMPCNVATHRYMYLCLQQGDGTESSAESLTNRTQQSTAPGNPGKPSKPGDPLLPYVAIAACVRPPPTPIPQSLKPQETPANLQSRSSTPGCE